MSTSTKNVFWDAIALDLAPEGGRPIITLPESSRASSEQVLRLMCSPAFDGWSEQASRVGFCANPIRLVGHTTTVDRVTGEVMSSYASADESAGVTFVRCGNRRADACPSCSRLYAADMFHVIRAGVTGGKGVPEQVQDNPLVFATLTAPSFGPVHGTRPGGGRCRPRADTAGRCPHGNLLGCRASHDEDDLLVGQPLCADCYDYDSQVVWQWWAPELWRRFTIALRRAVAHHLGVQPTALGQVASVQYAKVAEYQRRGAIHFHALIRLDGPPADDGFGPAPARVDATALAKLVQLAVASVRYTAAPVDHKDQSRVLAFAAQVDTRAVRTSRRTDTPGQGLSPEQVAGYLAKYSTKSATDTTSVTNDHLRQLHSRARHLATRACTTTETGDAANTAQPYALLGKWAASLGFRGHFATKSRGYSLTLGALRRARQRASARIAEANRTGTPIDLAQLEADLLADADDTTLVIGTWAYAGTGWADDAQTTLANAAAARAREYAQERARARKEQTEPRRIP